jgi:L-lysine exporter family protein LysE/ArgO
MEYLLLGFFTGLSLILAIGAQNIFVIEQGLKNNIYF